MPMTEKNIKKKPLKLKVKKRLGKNDWLEAALETLKTEGVEGVYVEPLAKKIGITKGSFYWHFKDRPALLKELLNFWKEKHTEGLVGFLENLLDTDKEGAEVDKLWELMKYINNFEPDAYDPAIRSWAMTDKGAASAMKDVDEKRLDIIYKLLLDKDIDDIAAMVRARMIYFYITGETATGLKESKGYRLMRAKMRYDIITQG